MFYKPVGNCKTAGLDGKSAKDILEKLLHTDDHAFIYHCYNHYFCPIGYEREPQNAKKIYENVVDDTDFTDTILIADTSKKYQSIHCVKWDDIEKDLNLKSPEYLNVRRLDLGIQIKKLKNKDLLNTERNLHCIIQFKRTDNCISGSTSSEISTISFPKLNRLDSINNESINNENDDFNDFEENELED